ncbi:MAG: hypothetical protein CMO82_06695 [Winogradskyella sp.]|uniref:M14 family zinc carboxypeptidase n=1 Tax=Winogradskyella poriferorum TaxID=307627 RepID=A0ABU7W8F9_9FLAO|nr:hypothetical protein [Winogradskyella sp.]|tara:strand:- start:11506 stop:16224 length:4719 start_codon:yes stop_codon:yes gene_type:complete
MKKITLVLLWTLFTTTIFSQNSPTGKRISISNPTHDQLHLLKDSGVDLSCGANFSNNDLILELSDSMIGVLDSNNVSYTILINDLTAHFENVTAVELPLAKAELAQKKMSNTQNRALSISTATIDNLVQYEGCSEINWDNSVPNNFNLGSMAGCLTYSEVLAELDEMRALYPNLISVKAPISTDPNHKTHGNSYTNGGQYDTWAGQDVLYVRISDNPDTDETNEPESLYSGMTHSREVSSMMNLIYYMWYLLENYDSDPGIKNLVDNHEMYFIPVANPDGLMWNEQIAPSGGGLQRKNLGPYNTGNNNARGVDLNRNYDYFWGPNAIYGGSSGTTSNQTYRGPSAFSEPETQGIEAFVASRNFVTAMNHHATSNLIPHAYNGYPNAPSSGREDDFAKFCHDMTRYNRYIYGEAPDILTIANGDMSDWMLGGVADVNGSTGSGEQILALAPENGAWDGSEGGFWPNPTQIVDIAQRAMRMNFMNAYYSGKFAQFHDLNTSDINTTSGNLKFGIEYLGQTLGDITLNVTPVSSNIISLTAPATQTSWTKLEQRELNVPFTLAPSIQANDKIEFQITLSNDDGYVMYQTNIIKSYNPTILFDDDADTNGLANWNNGGGTWNVTTDAYSGSTAITDSPSGSYSNNTIQTLTLSNAAAVDLTTSETAVVQFYAKWDLERNFDFVQFQASTDGSNWVELCGKYTKPGSYYLTTRYSSGNSSDTGPGKNTSDLNHQPDGEAIYDGNTQDKWVMEEFVIDASNNAFLLGEGNVQFRFVLGSDSSNRADGYSTTFDGFTFDDFKVIDIKLPCETTVPTNLAANSITASTAEITWDNVPSATYDLRYRETGAPSWVEITDITSTSYSLTSLDITTEYEVQVRSRCVSSTSAYSASESFTTADLVYCTAGGSTISDEYIGGISLNGTLNDTSSSTSSGYSDFTGASIFEPIQVGSTGNSLVVTKTWTGTQYDEAVSAWIDFNKDGDFDDTGEKVLEVGANQTTSVSSSFTVPVSASTGNTRMRVIMAYYNSSGTIQNDPCDSFQYGEVEDYDIYIYEGLLYTSATWYPNPPSDLTGSDNVTILDGTYNTTSDIAANNVIVASGATLNVSKENAVTVNGNITNNGEFVMNSDSNEFSSLLLSGSASDNLKYNRHVNSNTNRNDLISPPFSGESFVDFLSNNLNVVSNAEETIYLFGPFDKSVSNYLTYSNTDTSTLDAGKGYRTASTDNSTFTFTGAATTGDLNVPILKTGSAYEIWNLIGNPYPSYIKLEDFLTANVSQLDPSTAAVYGYDADNSNGSYWTIWNFAYATANPNTLIAPGQGFFVSSKDGGGTISFASSMQTSGNSDDFITGRNNSAIEFGSIILSSTDRSFKTDLYFTDNASLGLDVGYDASHFSNVTSDFAIYSELVNDNTGKDMAIQAIGFNDINNNTIIPLGVNANQGEQVTISLTDSNINTNVYLEDVIANTFTLLNTTDYTFTPSSDILDTGRFYLRFDTPSLSTNESNLDTIQVYSDYNNEQIVIKGLLTSKTQVSLFDIQGRQILKDDLNIRNSSNSLSTKELSTGVYLVKISNNVSSISKKVIIK